ncbi:MAG TPA: hypothetical protein VM287_08110 [Egibacteraceae bacterium]|nr:hypothetical protein [Egibacteraceae bacterium]
MGAFVSRRFRQWMLFAVGVPAAAWALDRLGEEMEERKGETGVTQALRKGGDFLHRHERGPAGRRRRR